MRAVEIVGIGWTPVGEHWSASLAELAHEAVTAAMADAGGAPIEALFVGSALCGPLGGQEHLGAHLAERLCLRGVETHRSEADGASGASALRLAELAIAGGAFQRVLVLGIDKTTDLLPDAVDRARAMGLDADHDAFAGLTVAGAGGLLMSRYLHEHQHDAAALAPFSVQAHRNALTAAHAYLRREITPQAYARAAPLARPLSVLDYAPEADGAAALVLASAAPGTRGVRITGSCVAHGPLALAARPEPLFFEAAARSVAHALSLAKRSLPDVSLFELDDALSIQAALSLEAAGFADRGHAPVRAAKGAFALGGDLPICTFGGSKARGNPLGAAGVYRVVEAVLQLRGHAKENQVRGAKVALAQSLGGLGATAITHVLE